MVHCFFIFSGCKPHHHVPYCFFNSKIHGDLVKKIGAVLWVTGSTSSRFSTTMAGMVGIPQLHTTLRPISSPGRQRNMDFKDLGRQHSCKWVVTRKLYVITINTNKNDKSTLVMYCNVMWCHVQVMRMSECLSVSLSLSLAPWNTGGAGKIRGCNVNACKCMQTYPNVCHCM